VLALAKCLALVVTESTMGQMLRRMYELESEVAYHGRPTHREVMLKQFPDLSHLPPELGLLVLSHLNATDLCLAACVWQNLGNDEILWHRYSILHSSVTCRLNFVLDLQILHTFVKCNQ